MFTCFDSGCFADGTYGHDRIRSKLADLCRSFSKSPRDSATMHDKGAELADLLQGPMSDDAWEEYEALDFLNCHAVDHSCYFDFVEGDLLLLEVEEEEA